MYGYRYGHAGGPMVLMMIVIVVLIALLLFLLLRNGHIKHNFIQGSNNTDKAIEILNEKFALGEITEEEYIKKKKLINS